MFRSPFYKYRSIFSYFRLSLIVLGVLNGSILPILVTSAHAGGDNTPIGKPHLMDYKQWECSSIWAITAELLGLDGALDNPPTLIQQTMDNAINALGIEAKRRWLISKNLVFTQEEEKDSLPNFENRRDLFSMMNRKPDECLFRFKKIVVRSKPSPDFPNLKLYGEMILGYAKLYRMKSLPDSADLLAPIRNDFYRAQREAKGDVSDSIQLMIDLIDLRSLCLNHRNGAPLKGMESRMNQWLQHPKVDPKSKNLIEQLKASIRKMAHLGVPSEEKALRTYFTSRSQTIRDGKEGALLARHLGEYAYFGLGGSRDFSLARRHFEAVLNNPEARVQDATQARIFLSLISFYGADGTVDLPAAYEYLLELQGSIYVPANFLKPLQSLLKSAKARMPDSFFDAQESKNEEPSEKNPTPPSSAPLPSEGLHVPPFLNGINSLCGPAFMKIYNRFRPELLRLAAETSLSFLARQNGLEEPIGYPFLMQFQESTHNPRDAAIAQFFTAMSRLIYTHEKDRWIQAMETLKTVAHTPEAPPLYQLISLYILGRCSSSTSVINKGDPTIIKSLFKEALKKKKSLKNYPILQDECLFDIAYILFIEQAVAKDAREAAQFVSELHTTLEKLSPKKEFLASDQKTCILLFRLVASLRNASASLPKEEWEWIRTELEEIPHTSSIPDRIREIFPYYLALGYLSQIESASNLLRAQELLELFLKSSKNLPRLQERAKQELNKFQKDLKEKRRPSQRAHPTPLLQDELKIELPPEETDQELAPTDDLSDEKGESLNINEPPSPLLDTPLIQTPYTNLDFEPEEKEEEEEEEDTLPVLTKTPSPECLLTLQPQALPPLMLTIPQVPAAEEAPLWSQALFVMEKEEDDQATLEYWDQYADGLSKL